MKRYALYFAPESASEWWTAGCQWLGREAESGQIMQQPAIAGLDSDQQWQLTTDARRYGFHATLKAPFRLKQGRTVTELQQALLAFCQQQDCIHDLSPQVQSMGKFLALRPSRNLAAINQLAFTCVRDFDEFRAPLSQADLARRQQHGLSTRQLALLETWGYPYTEEEFRFHMTLTDKLETNLITGQLQVAATAHFELQTSLNITGLALFVENEVGANFKLLARFPFSR